MPSMSYSGLFAEFVGIKLLLAHKQTSSLASLLEKIIRSFASTSTAATTKELHYLLRCLDPAACRQLDTFTGVAG